jgi:hypothetical protein
MGHKSHNPELNWHLNPPGPPHPTPPLNTPPQYMEKTVRKRAMQMLGLADLPN